MRGDFFDPDQNRAERKVGVCELVAGDDDPVAVASVLVEDAGEEGELGLYGRPLGLAPLRRLGIQLTWSPADTGTWAISETGSDVGAVSASLIGRYSEDGKVGLDV